MKKNEPTVSYHIFFYLKHCHFFKKKYLPAIRILATSHAVFVKFTVTKLRPATTIFIIF